MGSGTLSYLVRIELRQRAGVMIHRHRVRPSQIGAPS